MIFLRDVDQVTRTDLKPYCIEITTRDKTVYMASNGTDSSEEQ